MYFSSNIKLLRKRRKRTQDEVAHSLNMVRSTLSGYENEIAQPNINALIAFSDYYNISIDTLIKVNLQSLSESQLSELERGYDVFIKGSQLRVLTTTIDQENNENIELINEKAKAGYKNGYADPEYISELPSFQLPFLSKEKKYRTFQISGDSMLPIPDKAFVTAEFVQDWNFIKSGEAYIILTLDDGIVFKIVENQLQTNNSFKLISLNEIYDPYEVHVKEIKEIWKFVNYISNDMPDELTSQEQLQKSVNELKTDVEEIKRIVKKDGR